MPRSYTARWPREWRSPTAAFQRDEWNARVGLERSPSRTNPRKRRVVGGRHRASIPGEPVEVVEVVAVRGAGRVVSVRHQHDVSVANGLRDVGPVLRAIEPLNRKGAGRLALRSVVVDLFEHHLAGRPIFVVLVRWIARPVPGGSEHLHDQQAVRRELRFDDVVDLARRVSRAAHFDLDLFGRYKPGFKTFVSRSTANCHFDFAEPEEPVIGVTREIERPRHTVEHAGPAAELPALVAADDGTAASERHEGDLLASGACRDLFAVSQALDAKRQVPPGRGAGVDAVPLAVTQQEAAHPRTLSSCSRRGIASEHASWDATIAPATDPRRTASSRGRPRCKP